VGLRSIRGGGGQDYNGEVRQNQTPQTPRTAPAIPLQAEKAHGLEKRSNGGFKNATSEKLGSSGTMARWENC